jgi:hypothetical protein
MRSLLATVDIFCSHVEPTLPLSATHSTSLEKLPNLPLTLQEI